MQTWKMHLSFKKVESRHFHSRPPGKSLPQALIIPWQWEVTHPPQGSIVFENLLPHSKKGVCEVELGEETVIQLYAKQ